MANLSSTTIEFWAERIADLIAHGLSNTEVADYVGDCTPDVYIGIIRHLLEHREPQA